MTQPASAAGIGLRERKRRATSRAIQFTVLDLASAHGLDQVTVDEISRVANISPRTFFNYFASKEAAMVGENPLEIKPELIEVFVRGNEGDDVFAGLLELMQHMALLGTADHELHQRRRQVLRDYPELFAIKVAGMRGFEVVLADAVERRLEQDRVRSEAVPPSADPLAARARLTALVAIATMRHAFTLWAEGVADEPLSEKLDESFALLRRVL